MVLSRLPEGLHDTTKLAAATDQRRMQRTVQVTDDPELLNWWDEVQHKAHPDIKTGWPALRTVTDLRDILTTIAWTATAHHAAVGNGAPPPPAPPPFTLHPPKNWTLAPVHFNRAAARLCWLGWDGANSLGLVATLQWATWHQVSHVQQCLVPAVMSAELALRRKCAAQSTTDPPK